MTSLASGCPGLLERIRSGQDVQGLMMSSADVQGDMLRNRSRGLDGQTDDRIQYD